MYYNLLVTCVTTLIYHITELDYSTLANGETGHLEDQVQIYTFKFDEAIKVGEEGAITVNEDKKVVAVSDALEGARFSLTGVTDRNGKDISSKVFYTDTDETGAIVFTGLDEGKYLLQEIEAPEGYFLNPTVFTVDVNATYKDEYIDYYTIKVTNNDTKEEVTSIYYSDPNLEDNVNGTGIVDTELSKLPSTGGMGNIIFSVAGGVLFIGGAAILFMPKRKNRGVPRECGKKEEELKPDKKVEIEPISTAEAENLVKSGAKLGEIILNRI